MEVILLLNEMYTKFDIILETHNVYKVFYTPDEFTLQYFKHHLIG